MHSFAFAGRLAIVGFALLIAGGVPTTAQDQRRCLSIADVNERIDCLESGGAVPSMETRPTPNVRQPKQASTGPSFDCRAATNSIERAICGDATLSEWDSRMGQQFQQAMRVRKDGDTQSVLESQRAWLQQRNRSCGGVADSAVWACLLEMTKQRADALARLAAIPEVAPMVPPPAPTQIAPKYQAGPDLNAPSTNPRSSSASSIPNSNAAPTVDADRINRSNYPTANHLSPSFPVVQPRLQKYFCFSETQISAIRFASRLTGGAVRDRHGREAGCGGRGGADNERR
jgi:uncharacterized protein YecT (DUF1311 family)